MGRKRNTAYANEKFNDDFAKATVARLLRSYGAKGYTFYLALP